MADTYDFGPDPLDDDDLSPKQMLAGLISPASAQSLVLPPPNTPPQTGAAQTTPQTGSLRYAPTQAQPKVSGPPMIPGVAARPETLGLGNSSKITPSAITASQINAAGPGKLPALSPAMPNLGTRSSQVIASRGTVAGDTAEYNRLQNTGAGVDQIKNRWSRILGRIGDMAESVVAPGVAQFTPGTTLNHQRLLNQAANRVNQDYAGQQAQAQLEDTQSQTQQRNAQAQANAPRAITAEEAATMGDPTLEGQMWTPKAIATYTGTQSKNQATLGKQKSALEAQAAKNGQIVTFDDQGNPTFKDDPNSAAYQARAALNNYRDSMQKIAQMRADIQKQGVTPGSPAWNQKQEQLSIEQERAQSYWGNYLERSQGVGMGGNALPGAMIADNGQPVGSSFQANLRPIGQERARADLAVSAQTQLGAMRQILQQNPNLFGPTGGRYTNFQTWLGSQDPQAQRFRAAAQTAADHLAGVFGGRSEAALAHIYDVIGRTTTNPRAAIAGIDQIGTTLPHFVSQGTPRTVGSNAAQPGGLNPPNQLKTGQTPRLSDRDKKLGFHILKDKNGSPVKVRPSHGKWVDASGKPL